MKRLVAVLVLFLLPWLLAASFRTTNFVVTADSPQVAQQAAQAAEAARKSVAIAWLNHPLDDWSEPCPIRVTVIADSSNRKSSGGGSTSFGFDRGRVLGRSMNVEGPLDRLLVAVIPHEVTHTVFADVFKQPTPRWADEGAAVCSEDDREFQRHDKLCREILNTSGRMIPLKRLFVLTEYPGDVMALYAEGYCVTSWLISLKGRPQFLQFVGYGTQRGWDEASRVYYGASDVNDLERAWLSHMKSTRNQSGGGASGEGGLPTPERAQGAGASIPGDMKAGPAPATSDPTARALVLLAQSQATTQEAVRLLIEHDKIQDQRLDRLEGRSAPSQGSVGTQPPAWNQPPQKATVAPSVQPYRQGQFAQPYAAPPSVYPSQGVQCLPGRQ